MEVMEAIKARKSIRGYKPDPVPKKVLEEILEVARFAPSWANTQPWEVAVIGGGVMEELKQRLHQKRAEGVESQLELPEPVFSELYRERSRQLGRELFAALGIAREDREKRDWWRLKGVRFFDAPNGIIVSMDRELSSWSLLDVGLFMQSIMVAALEHGLGTCPEIDVVRYPSVVRDLLGIPQSKVLVCGIAIGYPDPAFPTYPHRSGRLPLESFVTWYGID